MNIKIEINDTDLKRLVIEEVRRQTGDITLSENDISIEVKSKQNYKAEWESAAFRAVCIKTIL